MAILGVTLVKRRIRNEDRLQLEVFSVQGDWESNGIWANVYQVNGFLVVQNLAFVPILVCKGIQELEQFILETIQSPLFVSSNIDKDSL